MLVLILDAVHFRQDVVLPLFEDALVVVHLNEWTRLLVVIFLLIQQLQRPMRVHVLVDHMLSLLLRHQHSQIIMILLLLRLHLGLLILVVLRVLFSHLLLSRHEQLLL